MDRKEFLSLIGFSAVAVALPTCMGSCSKTSSSLSVDFTLDLNAASNSALKNAGGYVISNGVIVARTTSGDYIAVSAACTHEGANVAYNSSGNNFVCPRHGATFNSTGGVTGGPTSTNLQKMNTSLNGTNLRVYS